jgi:hypothetical protein
VYSRKPIGHLALTTREPTYDLASKEFRQVMEVRSPGPRIDGELIKGILEHAERVFRGVLKMNNLTNYEWPPQVVDAEPHDDLRGADIVFMTRADYPKPTVLHS